MRGKLHRLILGICIGILFCGQVVNATENRNSIDNNRVVKVGYYEREGYFEKQEDGQLYGFGVDYLQTIATYTGWEYEYVANETDSGIRCRPKGTKSGWIYFSYWPEEYKPIEEDRYIVEGFHFDWKSYTSYADKDVRIPGGMSTYGKIWSYMRYDLETGDYAIINDGADTWFTENKDLIQAIRTLSNITVE